MKTIAESYLMRTTICRIEGLKIGDRFRLGRSGFEIGEIDVRNGRVYIISDTGRTGIGEEGEAWRTAGYWYGNKHLIYEVFSYKLTIREHLKRLRDA